jgi:hypothetical protein
MEMQRLAMGNRVKIILKVIEIRYILSAFFRLK